MLRFVQRRTENNTSQLEGYPDWLASLLAMRGVDTKEKAEAFLHPSIHQLHDPFLMKDMDKAAAMLKEAILKKTPIVVYGDYDVDGVSSTAMMVLALRSLGATVDYYIPSRHEEGYGLNGQAVNTLADKYRLLVTVDCGITAAKEVAQAKELGLAVIITDHHQLGPELPPADAILNPLMGEYPFRRLCGAGVVLKVLQALGGMPLAEEYLDLAALATIADLVPLNGENRAIAALGLAKMAETRRPGLKALMEAAGILGKEKKGVTAGQAAFGLAPRINAGGRLKSAALGVELLLTEDEKKAVELAQTLNDENAKRQGLEAEIFAQALAQVEAETDFYEDRVLFAAGEGWNHGVVGLAASRLTERFHYPAIVFAVTGEECVGSARSIPGVNIHEMLSTCRDLFLRFGGHEQAAGLTMKTEHLKELKARLSKAIWERCDPQAYIPLREYDLPITLKSVTEDMARRLLQLQPTGFSNPDPVFLLESAQVQDMRLVGRDGAHLKCSLFEGGAMRSAIGFQLGKMAASMPRLTDVLFAPELNEWNGAVTVQCNVKAIRQASDAHLPDGTEEAAGEAILQEILDLAANSNKIHPAPLLADDAILLDALNGAQGTVILCRARKTAERIAHLYGEKLVSTDTLSDRRGFHTLFYPARLSQLLGVWRTVILADGELLPGEADIIAQRCPKARILACPKSDALRELVRPLALTDDALRGLYKTCKAAAYTTLLKLSAEAQLSVVQVKTGLLILSELSLLTFTQEPYSLTMLPPVKRSLSDSRLLNALRALVP